MRGTVQPVIALVCDNLFGMNFFKTLLAAAELWYDRDADHMAATVSYYSLFAITPLLLLTITLLGLVVGGDTIKVQLLSWGAVLGPDILTLLSLAVQNLDDLSAGIGLPIFGAIFFSGMVVVMCNTVTSGLHHLWGIGHRGFKGWLKKCLNSISFIVILELYILSVIGVSLMVETLSGGTWYPILWTLKLLFIFLVTTLLFSLLYKVLPWESPSLKARILGASVAAVLFMVAKVLVALYVDLTPVPGLFGAAGLILALLIWVYVTACIVYFGAAVAKVVTD